MLQNQIEEQDGWEWWKFGNPHEFKGLSIPDSALALEENASSDMCMRCCGLLIVTKIMYESVDKQNIRTYTSNKDSRFLY